MTDAQLRQVLAENVRRRMGARPETLGTQQKLADRAGISKSSVGYVLRPEDENDATISTIAALARAFDCQPWELLANDDATRKAALRKILGDDK